LKETLALPDIVDVLGQRPYPLKETLLEYLQELRDRGTEEKAAETAKQEAEASATEVEEKAKIEDDKADKDLK
jgi:hypothetical protein